jgi:hypothetical protein
VWLRVAVQVKQAETAHDEERFDGVKAEHDDDALERRASAKCVGQKTEVIQGDGPCHQAAKTVECSDAFPLRLRCVGGRPER